MASRIRIASILGLLLAVAVSAPALAGGWAQAQLDAEPPPGEEGGTTEIGFTLLQHGVTPVDWGSVIVTAVNDATGETVSSAARSDGGDHWIASLALPSTGEWTISIHHDELEVLPKTLSLGLASAAPAAVSPATTATETSTGLVAALIGFVVLLVGVGAGLLLSTRRRGTGSTPAAGAQPTR